MAWIFSLSAECGPSQADALAVAGHFAARQGTGQDVGQGAGQGTGWAAGWVADVVRDDRGNWWAWAVPGGLSRTGIGSDADARAMTEAGHHLYACLRSAPARYRYALAGVEADMFRFFDELTADEDLGAFPGLVLADGVWELAGRPPGFTTFSPGYRWLPYPGEGHPA
ncbi:hypothetical protein J5Y04_23915 [Kitasatospora sp. RG8]|uniref:hypothetical protein n=1 Tax=Kitasatospora sp. RG8 TaxID=2820815 RepID=UPI001ADFB388|nr:hypothetical protein [Kitasatospora sp. RG8]MBP0452566.1 hypothetical protein [Kitasatospora sp. RG8]